MTSYASNNIEFRIVSSNAICQFKADQAFDFNELVHNQVYKFSHKNREILLLAYDTFFGYILQLEKCFVRNNTQNMITEELLHTILSLYDECIISINSILLDHSSFFDHKSVEILKLTHSHFIAYTRRQISSVENTSIMIAFPTIVNILSEILNDLLYEIHEVDFLLYGDKTHCTPFLSFSRTCYEMYASNIDILSERLSIYKKYFPLCESFAIKNYTHHIVNIENLVKSGINIVNISFNDQCLLTT